MTSTNKDGRETGLYGAAGSALKLARFIARGIFILGDEPGSPCKRMQFKGGTWTPDKSQETDQGGISEEALADHIARLLSLNEPNNFDEPIPATTKPKKAD